MANTSGQNENYSVNLAGKYSYLRHIYLLISRMLTIRIFQICESSTKIKMKHSQKIN